MGVSPGTGAGIGIAIGLLVLFVAGPGAYYYQKRRRRQLNEAGEHGSRYSDILRAGDDHFGGGKPQLEDTAVSPTSAWRISRSTVNDGPIVVPEAATTGGALGIDLGHPTTPGRGAQELDVLNQGRRPEMPTEAASPPPTELRAEKSPPVESVVQKHTKPLANAAVEPREQYVKSDAKSDESIQFPPLPGPILPPKTSGGHNNH